MSSWVDQKHRLENLDGSGEIGGRPLSFIPARNRWESCCRITRQASTHGFGFSFERCAVLKPGSAEPWTPFRIIQALIRAGARHQAFSFYPPTTPGPGRFAHVRTGIVFGDTASRVWSTMRIGSRARFQQGRHRRRLYRSLGAIPRRDG